MERFDRQLFGERLFELVDGSEMPFQDVAADIGVSPHMLERYMRGESLPDIRVLRKICVFFHVRADYLLFMEK